VLAVAVVPDVAVVLAVAVVFVGLLALGFDPT